MPQKKSERYFNFNAYIYNMTPCTAQELLDALTKADELSNKYCKTIVMKSMGPKSGYETKENIVVIEQSQTEGKLLNILDFIEIENYFIRIGLNTGGNVNIHFNKFNSVEEMAKRIIGTIRRKDKIKAVF